MPTVRVILPYFGKWPAWMRFYLAGCARNPEFNFLLVTDSGQVPAPPNVQFVQCELEHIRERVREKLGLSVPLRKPYKLCDLKPAFGLIFDDLLGGYEFWGTGDIDCVYGRLCDYASAEVLGRVDIFSCRKEYVSGVLHFVRNIPKMNNLFRNSPDWQTIFAMDRYCGFDEVISDFHGLILGGTVWDPKREFCSYTEIVFEAIKRGEVRGYFETVALEEVHSIVEINDRGVFENWTAYALVHLLNRKARWFFNVPDWREIPPRCYLTRFGVIRAEQAGLLHQLLSFEYMKAGASALRKVLKRIK